MVVSKPSGLVLLVVITLMSVTEVSGRSLVFGGRKVMSGGSQNSYKYAVVFDAGSSGSRVHVFCFDDDMNLVPFDEKIEIYQQTKPGLSSYAEDPEAAAESLAPLLETAEDVVPQEQRSKTPVQVGATAGLRLLEGNASDSILQAVRDLLENSSLKYDADAVTILSGYQEGSYIWIAINYLLGNLGNNYSHTVGTVDLGGGSVQISYAISDKDASTAPPVVPDGNDLYVKEQTLLGTKYNLYAYSYLNYGLLAARAGILNVTGDSANPCILAGYDGVYKYNSKNYTAKALSSGPSLEECKSIVLSVLNVNETCSHKSCTFGGVWDGGKGDGQKNLYVASFFYDIALEVGLISSGVYNATAYPADFLDFAKVACETKYADANSTFPAAEEYDLPFLCLDLIYEYTLLVHGFGLDPSQKITLVTKIEYQNFTIGAAWPLGSAIETLSSSSSTQKLFYAW